MLLVALFEAGLLTEGSTQVDFPSVPFNSSRHAVAVTAFNLTAAAGSAATYEKREFDERNAYLCCGTPIVDRVLRYTGPDHTIGGTVSEVAYQYHLADIPAWASSSAVNAAFPTAAANSVKQLSGSAVLIRTDDGWIHADAAKARGAWPSNLPLRLSP
jgi:hypothetical protein